MMKLKFAVLFFLVCLLLLFIFFVQKKVQPKIIKPAPTSFYKASIDVSIPDSREVDSLDVLPLFEEIKWEEASQSSHFLHYQGSTKKGVKFGGYVPLTGKTWRGSITLDQNGSSALDIYYKQMEKLGWTSFINISGLKLDINVGQRYFGTGFSYYIAHKNGLIGILTISSTYSPIERGRIFPEEVPTPTSFTAYEKYVIFASDPISIEKIKIVAKENQ